MKKKEEGNIKKYLSYRAAYAMMNKAIDLGFYLEAITIQESIISDRLLSFIIGKGIKNISEKDMHKSEANLFALIKLTTNFMPDDPSLVNALDQFRIDRNRCVHLLVKSFPGKPTIDVKDFIALAKQTSENGKKLTRRVLLWHNKQRKLK